MVEINNYGKKFQMGSGIGQLTKSIPTNPLITYNSRYPGFDEEDYKKLEQGAINRGLTGQQKTQFMDEAYQHYYPQVLNKHKLDERDVEINKTTADNGNAILNGDKQASWNMKLLDLAQTAKRVKGLAYDYPDNQVIDAMKNNIPNGEQLILNYLNNNDTEILQKAGLIRTQQQQQSDAYNMKRAKINNALSNNWRQLSDDGVKYVRDYNIMFEVVDAARQDGMGQGLSDSELLLNLIYLSPELQQLEKEIGGLQLSKNDKAILGEAESRLSNNKNMVINDFRNFVGWNSSSPATYDDLQEEIYVRENMDGETWKNIKANFRNWGDSIEKFAYRAPKDFQNWAYNLNLDAGGVSEEKEAEMREKMAQNKQYVKSYNEMLDKEIEKHRAKIGLDPIIQNYYSDKGMLESLSNGQGFGYKALGDAAGNYDMIFGIGAGLIHPALGMLVMGTDTFARENQESFDSLIEAQTKQGVSYEDAYDNAVQGAFVVGAVNTAIELGLESLLGGVETTTSKNIKSMFTRDLNKEVSEMVAKRGIADMLKNGLTTQARASLEEGLEEVMQQIVHNIAISGYDPDHKISDGLWQAFESGTLNPMNLLAGGTALLSSPALSDIDRQTFLDWATQAGESAGTVVDTMNPKNIWSSIKKGGNNNTNNNPYLTRTFPIWQENNKLRLGKAARDVFASKGTDGGTVMLELGLAGKSDGDKIVGLEKRGQEGYDNVTKVSKDFGDEMIDNTEGAQMAKFLADEFEKDSVMSLTRKDEIANLREIEKMKQIPFSLAQQFKRDFDHKKSDAFYKANGQLKDSVTQGGKEDLVNLRNKFSEKINEVGDKHGVDIRSENEKVTEAVLLRDAIIENMNQEQRADFLKVKDVILSMIIGGNFTTAAALIAGNKLWDRFSGKVSQGLYNLNKQPVEKNTPLKKGAGFINTQGRNEFNYGLSNLNNSSSNMSNGQELQGPIIDAGDLGNLPLDTIKDKNVGVNPTDIVVSENVNQMAGNTAQELYNEGDDNLSNTQTDMTEKFNTNDGADYIQAQTEWYEDRRHDLENGEERWTDYTDDYNQVTEDEHLKWVRNRVKEISKDISEDKINELEDAWNNLGEDEKLDEVKKYRKATADWSPAGETNINYEGTEEDLEELRQTNPEEYENLMDEEYELEQSRQEEANETKPQQQRNPLNEYGYNKLHDDLKNATDLLFNAMRDYNKTGNPDSMKIAEQAQERIRELNKQIQNYLEGDKANEEVVKSYTAEELGLPPVSATMLKNLDRSKYIPVEDPNTRKVVFYKVGDLKENFQLSEQKQGDTLDWLDKISDKKIQNIDGIIKKTLSKEEYNTWKDRKGNVSEGRALFSRLTSLFGYDKTSSILKEAGYDAYSSDDKLYKFENGKTYREYQPNDYDRAKKTKGKTKQYADNSYKPSITMSEKTISKKQAKEEVNNLISDTWSDIGDEGDWDWYKKMKKKDVITYLEDQVSDEFRRSNYGIEWSEVQKLIKKFVNNKMK